MNDPRPVTGHRLIDAALVNYGELADHDPADHHDRLAQVHDVLGSVLDSSRDAVQIPIPGLGSAGAGEQHRHEA